MRSVGRELPPVAGARAAGVADDRPLRRGVDRQRDVALRSGWSKQAKIRWASSRKLCA
jgi:hypothetical protein